MSDTGTGNLQWAYALLDGLAAAGVDRVVISPGSRSTPLALASEFHPGLRTWVQIDERCAAFFALGMARLTATPVALIATSGSAPTHWYPAVIEADQAAVPLILLSADRPLELQGCGANQTIDQANLFQRAVRAYHALPAMHHHPHGQTFLHSLASRAVHQSRWPLPGPVHINIPFHEPLLAEPLPELKPAARSIAVESPRLVPTDAQLDRVAQRIAGQPGLIVCGPGHFGVEFAPALARLAATLNWPVLADPLSGLRFGEYDRSRVLCHYDAFLRQAAFSERYRPQWVLRFGSMPVSRSLMQYLQLLQAGQLIIVDPFGRWPDPLHRAGEMLRATAQVVCERLTARISDATPASWWKAFSQQEQAAARLRLDLLGDGPWFEAQLVHVLLETLPAGGIVFAGNSMPVRELDSFSAGDGKPLQLIANRGASGIDGHVSSLLGLASAAAEGTRVTGLIGDLAFYHDMNGLLAARDCDATLIIINNNGGGIFRYLPQAGLAGFKRYWSTPTGLDFRQAAALYRLPFQRVDSSDGFNQALNENLAHPGVNIIEAVIDPQHSVERHRAYWEAVSNL